LIYDITVLLKKANKVFAETVKNISYKSISEQDDT
jgi:hypothetical protein